MWVYSDYLEVKRDFIPVFSAGADRKYPGAWKSFIPHKDLRDILDGLLRALDRGRAEDKKSQWIHGTYGTGKTFSTFVLKHLLEDDWETVQEYCSKHQAFRDLWLRLEAQRQRGRFLVIPHTASAHITSSLKLLVEMQQTIKRHLVAIGHPEAFGTTICDRILRELKDPDSGFHWNKVFYKHRDEVFPTFSAPEQVIEKLDAGSVQLAETVANLMEKKGFWVMDSPATVTDWLREVFREGNLQGIVFVWDEFTDFFANNVSTTALSELAEVTMELPFYLLLVTHKSPQYFHRMDEDTRKKLMDRFKNYHFEMRPVTAYQLVTNALEAKAESREQWEIRKDGLWGKIARITQPLISDELRRDDFRGLIPIHPFAAHLLAMISKQFSSSQRSLFLFLKGEDPDQPNFVQFLREHPRDDWFWYTADNLWDYFFREDNTELTEQVRDLVGYGWTRIEDLMDEDEKKVFKALMLLMALWRQSGGPLLRPTRSRLELAFSATPLAERVKDIMQSLCDREVVHALAIGADEEYTVPLMIIDQRKIKDLRDKIKAANTFEKVVGVRETIGKRLVEAFALGGAAEMRLKLSIVSEQDLRNKLSRVEPVIQPYEIGVVLVVGQDEYQLVEAERRAAELAEKALRCAYVVIEVPFDSRRWEDWINHQAHQRYCVDVIRNLENAQIYERRAQDTVSAWMNLVQVGQHKSYFREKEATITGRTGFEKFFRHVVQTVFPYGPEQVAETNTLYATRFGKSDAEIGLGVRANVSRQYKDLIDELIKLGFWDGDTGFSRNPEHPISRMKKDIDNLFAQGQQMQLKVAWEQMQDPPYGLMPCVIGATLMGLVLRGYAEGYYWWDGANSRALNHDKLAELINQIMKGSRNYDSVSIRKVSPEGEQFCQLVRELFGLPEDKTRYPGETRKELRNHVNRFGYPLWALVQAVDEEDAEYGLLSDALQKLESIVSVPEERLTDLDDLQLREAGQALFNARRTLPLLMKKEKFEAGMKHFITSAEPSLSVLMGRLALDMPVVVSRLKLAMNEEIWLWQAEKVKDRLPELSAEFELIDGLNQLCGINLQKLDEAIEHFAGTWLKRAGRLPLMVLAVASEDLITGKIIKEISDLVSTRGRAYARKRELGELLKKNREDIRQAIGEQRGALTRWVGQALKLQLSTEEAGQILAVLPDLTGQSDPEEVSRVIKQQVDALGKRKLASEIKALWVNITGSRTPAEWSIQHKIPICWVLEGPAFADLFKIVNKPENQTERDLQKAKERLQNQGNDFGLLKEDEIVNQRFLAAVAGENRGLIQEKSDVDDLKNYLYQRLGGNVYDWPVRLNEVRNAVREWSDRFYQKKTYPAVLKRIEELPEAQAKNLLKRLAVYPDVGILVLRPGGG
jgi:hypothetical protein